MLHTLRFFAFILALVPVISLGQNIPTMGTNISQFTLFTATGALTNTGASEVTGSIGTNNSGAFTGFTPGTVMIGTTHINDATSIAAGVELWDTYNHFITDNVCGTTLSSTLQGPQTLNAGSYCTVGATTIGGEITLDAQSDPNAEFVFAIGGALSLDGTARIILLNGARLENVYFQVDGAVNMAAQSEFRGTVVSSGAISLMDGASLYGKALTMDGALSIHNNIVSGTEIPLPVTLTSFNVKKEGQSAFMSWSTTMETNSDRFEIENSKEGKNWNLIGTVNAGGESNTLSSYVYSIETTSPGINLYRLKIIDKDESYVYSRIRSVDFATGNRTIIYPNPTIGALTLDVDNISDIERLQFNDLNGKVVYEQIKTSSRDISEKMDVTSFPAGIYSIKVIRSKGAVSYLKILKL